MELFKPGGQSWNPRAGPSSKLPYRIAISQSPVEFLEHEDADSLAAPIPRPPIVKGVAPPVLVNERAIGVVGLATRPSKLDLELSYPTDVMAMDWSGVSRSWLAPARAMVDSSDLSVRQAWCNATRLPDYFGFWSGLGRIWTRVVVSPGTQCK